MSEAIGQCRKCHQALGACQCRWRRGPRGPRHEPVSDLETAREWLEKIGWEGRTPSIGDVAALLRSRDERALRIVKEIRQTALHRAYGWGPVACCDEIERRIEASDDE